MVHKFFHRSLGTLFPLAALESPLRYNAKINPKIFPRCTPKQKCWLSSFGNKDGKKSSNKIAKQFSKVVGENLSDRTKTLEKQSPTASATAVYKRLKGFKMSKIFNGDHKDDRRNFFACLFLAVFPRQSILFHCSTGVKGFPDEGVDQEDPAYDECRYGLEMLDSWTPVVHINGKRIFVIRSEEMAEFYFPFPDNSNSMTGHLSYIPEEFSEEQREKIDARFDRLVEECKRVIDREILLEIQYMTKMTLAFAEALAELR